MAGLPQVEPGCGAVLLNLAHPLITYLLSIGVSTTSQCGLGALRCAAAAHAPVR